MIRRIRRACLLLLTAFVSVPAAAALRDEGFDVDRALRASQAVIGQPLGGYTLIGSDGQPLRLDALRGKPLLISFIYTGCFQICPSTTRNLKLAVQAAERTLGTGTFNVVSIGFNQPFDTPEAMGAFAREQGVQQPYWKFLGIDQATLEALSRNVGFSYQGAAAGFEHITQITVVDATGRIYRQIYGDNFPLPQLVAPLKELIAGEPPAQQTLTQLIERVRILCTVYDPVSGQYRYKYSILLEIAGGLFSLAAVGVFLLRELRRGRLSRPSQPS